MKNQVYSVQTCLLDPGTRGAVQQVFQLGDQPNARPLVLRSQTHLMLILSTLEG